ncbi:hypothetical protein AAF712_015167 [Marasmius tenuissimus]|uniref:Cytochrome P450 n=1 Tax=Marasmius tenuissimus TaxID=585030 RepID=A0ABR2ZA57_9AGAR
MLPGALAVLVAVLIVTYATYRTRTRSFKYPPGPRRLPLIGNLLQLPSRRQWVKFREWALEYGPIYYLKAGPVDIFVLNTPEAAEDLLVKHNRIFGDRMAPHVAHDIVSAGQRMVFLPGESPEYKTIRKVLGTELGPAPSKGHRRIQELESRVVLYDLLSHGNKTAELMGEKLHARGSLHDTEFLEKHWFSLVRRFSTSIVLQVMYGERVHKIKENEALHDLYEVVDKFTDIMLPGSFLADTFTFLQKLPDFLSPWRLEAQRMHRRYEELSLYGGFLDRIRAEHNAGTSHQECFVGKYLEDRGSKQREQATAGCGLTPDGGWLRDTLLAYTAGTILEAGSDTTTSTITSFLLFMLRNPNVVQKAQEEIDRVVGRDRLPTFDDEQNLPYVVAIVKEVMRCRPAIPVGIPHRSTEDIIYNGYLIPKGSVVFGNIWAIHLDPDRFENPKEFNPDRWLKDSQIRWGSSGSLQARDNYAFGWGRRFCLGSSVAEASLFIIVAQILWGLDLQGPKNPSTGEVQSLDPWDEENFTTGAVMNAVPFNVSFQPRSEHHREVIEHGFNDAQEQWEMLGLKRDER